MTFQNAYDILRAGTGFMEDIPEMLRWLEGKGYTANLVPRYDHFEANDGAIRIYPRDFVVDELLRYENTSDPDDQAAVYAISSKSSGVKGVYVEAYGIYQDELSARMIDRLKRHRHLELHHDSRFAAAKRKRGETMKKVETVMSRDVQCMAPNDTVSALARRMRELNVGALPVCDNGRLAGMVTDRDIVLKALANGRDPRSVTAREVMSSPIVFCFDDQEIDECARIMEARQVRRLVVLNRDKQLVGIVSLSDLAVRGGSEEISAEVLEKVSKHGRTKAA